MPAKLRKPQSGREAAVQVVVKTGQGCYVNLALKQVLATAGLPVRERNLATEISYGVIRHLATLQWVLGQFLSRPPEKLTPWIMSILLCGSYQLLYLKKIPASAAVNEAVSLARVYGHQGVAGLVNGVLRRLQREQESLPWPKPDKDPVAYLALQQSYPEWMLKRWIARFGLTETAALAAAGNIPPAVTLRVNPLKTDLETLQRELEAEGIPTKPGLMPGSLELTAGGSPAAASGFRQGKYTIQSQASMAASLLLDPQPGETILDLCSAPGGKTTHMAELMQDQGRIIACDLHSRRVDLVTAAVNRLSLTCVQPLVFDGRQPAVDIAGAVHRVLLDAPCSGLGIIRRKPDLKWQRQPADIDSLAQLQRQLLSSAATALKPGGVLVYAVCTFEPEETSLQISDFLRSHPWMEPDGSLGQLPAWFKDLAGLEPPGLFLYPHRDGMDGFYLCRLVRRN